MLEQLTTTEQESHCCLLEENLLLGSVLDVLVWQRITQHAWVLERVTVATSKEEFLVCRCIARRSAGGKLWPERGDALEKVLPLNEGCTSGVRIIDRKYKRILRHKFLYLLHRIVFHSFTIKKGGYLSYSVVHVFD